MFEFQVNSSVKVFLRMGRVFLQLLFLFVCFLNMCTCICNVNIYMLCCDPWDHKESDTTEQMKWTELNIHLNICNIKNYDKPRQYIQKQRHHFADKDLYSQGFPVVIYRYESWTIKKKEHWRTDAFELWCWRKLLWVPWTARRLSQSMCNLCKNY